MARTWPYSERNNLLNLPFFASLVSITWVDMGHHQNCMIWVKLACIARKVFYLLFIINSKAWPRLSLGQTWFNSFEAIVRISPKKCGVWVKNTFFGFFEPFHIVSCVNRRYICGLIHFWQTKNLLGRSLSSGQQRIANFWLLWQESKKERISLYSSS